MYANVILDRVSDALDHVFTYAVPEGMDAREGQQVCVPLGNARADGFIVELTDECALEPSRIKPILALRTAEPVILPELMALEGDRGGSGVIRRHEEALLLVEAAEEELWDVDTPQALAILEGQN